MAYVDEFRIQARKMALFGPERAPFSAIFPLRIQGTGHPGQGAVKARDRIAPKRMFKRIHPTVVVAIDRF
jgi:hypothetical protein